MSGRLGAIVAGCLGGVLILCVAAIAVLAGLDKSAPGVLENLAAGSLGALAALLARVGGADEVRVVNRPDQPVPVEGDAGLTTVELLLGIILLILLLALLGVVSL